MTTLAHSSYMPGRGGHAPGDVRDAFLEALDAYEAWDDGEPEPTVDLRGRPVSLSTLCGLLWNCSDIMPGSARSQMVDMLPFGITEGHVTTYARAARALKSEMARVSAAA